MWAAACSALGQECELHMKCIFFEHYGALEHNASCKTWLSKHPGDQESLTAAGTKRSALRYIQ